jgi:hypothetical protein
LGTEVNIFGNAMSPATSDAMSTVVGGMRLRVVHGVIARVGRVARVLVSSQALSADDANALGRAGDAVRVCACARACVCDTRVQVSMYENDAPIPPARPPVIMQIVRAVGSRKSNARVVTQTNVLSEAANVAASASCSALSATSAYATQLYYCSSADVPQSLRYDPATSGSCAQLLCGHGLLLAHGTWGEVAHCTIMCKR